MPLVANYPGQWSSVVVYIAYPMILPCSDPKDILVTLVTSCRHGHRSLVTMDTGHWSLEVVIRHTGHTCHRHT